MLQNFIVAFCTESSQVILFYYEENEKNIRKLAVTSEGHSTFLTSVQLHKTGENVYILSGDNIGDICVWEISLEIQCLHKIKVGGISPHFF